MVLSIQPTARVRPKRSHPWSRNCSKLSEPFSRLAQLGEMCEPCFHAAQVAAAPAARPPDSRVKSRNPHFLFLTRLCSRPHF